MRIKRFAYALIVFLALPGALWAIDVDDPPAGLFEDQWYAVMLKGHKSGYGHSTMERVKRPGGDFIRTRITMVIQAMRGEDNLITVSVTQETEEALDGKPLAFSNSMTLGRTPSTTRGKIEDGKVMVTTSQFDKQSHALLRLIRPLWTRKRTYDLPEGAMMSWGAYRQQIKRGLKPGTNYELPLYDPSIALDKLVMTTMEVLGREMVDLFGRKVDAIKTRQTVRLPGMFTGATELETVTWLTDEGAAVRVEMSMMNMPIAMVACARSVALAPNDPAEIMLDTLIRVDQPIGRNARRVTYHLRFKKPGGKATLPELPETDSQRIVRRGRRAITLTVTRQAERPRGGETGRLTDEQRRRYLAPSSMVNYKDPVIARLVRRAADDEKDPWMLAGRFCEFAGEYMTKGNLNVGFATASEVARSREGDCTEHGVLLAAMGRAAGIPTRIVIGVVYADRFAGQQQVFVGHLWTQFWIEGKWIDLDATRNQVGVDPTHIALSMSDAGDTGIADLVSSLWLDIGNLAIEVVSSE